MFVTSSGMRLSRGTPTAGTAPTRLMRRENRSSSVICSSTRRALTSASDSLAFVLGCGSDMAHPLLDEFGPPSARKSSADATPSSGDDRSTHYRWRPRVGDEYGGGPGSVCGHHPHVSLRGTFAGEPVKDALFVQPFHLIVDAAGLGQLDVAPGGQIERVQPPPHPVDPILVRDPRPVRGH